MVKVQTGGVWILMAAVQFEVIKKLDMLEIKALLLLNSTKSLQPR